MARRSGLVLFTVLALCIGAGAARAKLGAATPTAPTNVKATRAPDGTTARLTFVAAKPRGQKVTGYSALCRDGGPAYRHKVVGKHSPATLEGLEAGVAYGCTLQGRSRAGFGAESKGFVVYP